MTSYQYADLSYEWDGKRWRDANGVLPPMSITQHLNRMLEADLSSQDDNLQDPVALSRQADIAMKAGQVGRAIRLILRALELTPSNDWLAARAVSILRKANRSDEAVPILKRFRQTECVPLLVTGAAVLCDVERWEDALTVVQRALSLEKSGEAFAVYSRIRKHRPDLLLG